MWSSGAYNFLASGRRIQRTDCMNWEIFECKWASDGASPAACCHQTLHKAASMPEMSLAVGFPLTQPGGSSLSRQRPKSINICVLFRYYLKLNQSPAKPQKYAIIKNTQRNKSLPTLVIKLADKLNRFFNENVFVPIILKLPLVWKLFYCSKL